MIITSTPEEIGRRIREIRRSKEMSQEELGRKVGVTRATINKYEYGQVNFPRDRVEKLSKALNVSPSYLLGWDEEQTANYVPVKKARLFDPANIDVTIENKTGSTAFVEMKTGSAQGDEIKPSAGLKAWTEIVAKGSPAIQANDPIMAELVRIYAALSIKDRNKLLTYAYELEEKKCEQ